MGHLALTWVSLRSIIVAFPGHTDLFFGGVVKCILISS